MPSFVTHLESAIDGTKLPHDILQTMHAGRPWWVRYDLPQISKRLNPEMISARAADMWRWRELLPVPPESPLVTLGESETPLLSCPKLGKSLGIRNFWIKDESRLPTGSFKARGMALAVNMAKHFGVSRLAIPSAGNAGGAMAAYAVRAGIEAFVFMPRDTPIANQIECVLCGAKTFLVNGLINDCAAIVRNGAEAMKWFDCSTLKEPYRLEGKKTMGLELAHQLDYSLPDVILYPTGGGTGLIGMWKAFHEMRQLGWLKSEQLPRMICVQSDGCAPIVRAFAKGERFAETWKDAHTVASGLRVPGAVGDFMILDAIRESGGIAVEAREADIVEAAFRSSRFDGIAICPESAACVAVAPKLVQQGVIRPDDRVVLFNTGAASKYTEVLRTELPVLQDPAYVDYSRLA